MEPRAQERAFAAEVERCRVAARVNQQWVAQRVGLSPPKVSNADIHPGAPRPGRFSYSTFTPLGPDFSMHNDWRFFMGYRFAIFNHATQALGGAVTVERFELATP